VSDSARLHCYEISAEVTFAASHQIRDEGAELGLEPLHGHNFRLEAFVSRPSGALPESGLVMDFLDLEEKLREVVAPYDHRHLNDLPPFDAVIPTTENLAHFFFGELEKRLPDGVELRRVRVWEAPTYSATYGYGYGNECGSG
jgi:6-pyruvoyltetrahydropterin/6-carboxytetrahydropterin synthase